MHYIGQVGHTETGITWRTVAGGLLEARDFTHDIRVLEGSLFEVARWLDGFTC